MAQMVENLPNKYDRRFYREFCTKKMKTNKTTRGQEVSNHRRRKDKESESSTDAAAHNYILKHTEKKP
jgi:hypothetical protein